MVGDAQLHARARSCYGCTGSRVLPPPPPDPVSSAACGWASWGRRLAIYPQVTGGCMDPTGVTAAVGRKAHRDHDPRHWGWVFDSCAEEWDRCCEAHPGEVPWVVSPLPGW